MEIEQGYSAHEFGDEILNVKLRALEQFTIEQLLFIHDGNPGEEVDRLGQEMLLLALQGFLDQIEAYLRHEQKASELTRLVNSLADWERDFQDAVDAFCEQTLEVED